MNLVSHLFSRNHPDQHRRAPNNIAPEISQAFRKGQCANAAEWLRRAKIARADGDFKLSRSLEMQAVLAMEGHL